MVARTLEPRERALGNGIFTSGTSVGALLAPGSSGYRPACRMALGVRLLIGSLGVFWICACGHYRRETRRWNPVWREPGAKRDSSPGKLFAGGFGA